MTPLSIAYVATATICLLAGVRHLLLAVWVENRAQQILLGIACLGVAGDSVFGSRSYSSSSAEEFLSWMPWTALCVATSIVCLSWYVALRTGIVRRGLLWAVSTAAVAATILDFSVGIAYRGPVELSRSILPWGEPIAQLSGAFNVLRIVGDLAMIGFLLILWDTTMRAGRAGRRRQARLLGFSASVYGVGLLTIIAVDLGSLSPPSLHTFSFLVIIGAVSWEESQELVRTARLSRKVIAGERRFRQLVREVQLLAVRTDTSGRITEVNPHFTQVLGYAPDELIGTEYRRLVRSEDQVERQEALLGALSGDAVPEAHLELLTKDGGTRDVLWRNVQLQDESGAAEGVLSFGADVTELQATMAERDRALANLERSVRELEELKDRLEEENLLLMEEVGQHQSSPEIRGSSPAMLYVLDKIDQVAEEEVTVLIQGETGVGKELVARSIHRASRRSNGPFVAVNCATIPLSLADSDLFGHEKGAFTGAEQARRGRFESADGGTLFLDEIGDLPLEVQPKLLRVLQEGEFERVGGDRVRSVDVRLIAATNHRLRAEVEAGRFRQDLYYRLEVFPISVPPLRQRKGDIPQLVEHFTRHFAQEHNRRIDRIPVDLMRQLESYRWPGNVRELMNIIERSVLLSQDGVLKLPETLAASDERSPRLAEAGNPALIATLEEVERSHIESVVAACDGQISGRGGAAQILGIHPNTLRSRMKKLGIGPRPENNPGPL